MVFLAGIQAALLTANNATSTTNDVYVFAYSWTPEFCYGQSSYAGCETPEAYWGKDFTLHGLWPQYVSGGYPYDCTTEAYDPNVPIKIGWDTMTQYWPNVKYVETDPNYDSFWEHEWTKHGTCTGLSQYDYFNSAINLIKIFGTPASVTNAVGGSISASQLRNDFGGASYVALQCESGSYLSAAFSCWSNVNGIPTKQIVCPSDVQLEDTCTASTLKVQSF